MSASLSVGQAQIVDEVLCRLFRLRHGWVPDWLGEHREQERYPDRDMLSDAVPPSWTISREVKSGNVVSQTVLVLGDHVPGAQRINRHLEQRWRDRGVPRLLDRGLTYRRIFVLQPASVF